MNKRLARAVTYSAVCVGEWDFRDSCALIRSVQSLGDQDRARNRQVVLARDQGCATEIGRRANALNDAGQGDEGFAARINDMFVDYLGMRITYTSV